VRVFAHSSVAGEGSYEASLFQSIFDSERRLGSSRPLTRISPYRFAPRFQPGYVMEFSSKVAGFLRTARGEVLEAGQPKFRVREGWKQHNAQRNSQIANRGKALEISCCSFQTKSVERTNQACAMGCAGTTRGGIQGTLLSMGALGLLGWWLNVATVLCLRRLPIFEGRKK
jgi:hypothetical protein